MKDSIFEADCPCCGARLEIDGDRGVVLSHQPGRPAAESRKADLTEGLARVKREEAEREQRFAEQLAANRRREDALGKRFEGLLRKQRGKKPARPELRDFELD